MSLTGSLDFLVHFWSEFIAKYPSQGAHLSGPDGLGLDRASLPCSCFLSHLEYLDPMAGAAGEENS